MMVCRNPWRSAGTAEQGLVELWIAHVHARPTFQEQAQRHHKHPSKLRSRSVRRADYVPKLYNALLPVQGQQVWLCTWLTCTPLPPAVQILFGSWGSQAPPHRVYESPAPTSPVICSAVRTSMKMSSDCGKSLSQVHLSSGFFSQDTCRSVCCLSLASHQLIKCKLCC